MTLPNRRSFLLNAFAVTTTLLGRRSGLAASGASLGPKVRDLATGLGFPEGPIALDDGSVLLVEISEGVLSRVDPDGTRRVVAQTGGGPNGAAIGPDGACYVCNDGGYSWSRSATGALTPGLQPPDYSGGRIERIDLRSGAVQVLYTAADGNPLRGPNDIVFDAAGGFWFTDYGKSRTREQDKGGLYYAHANGAMIREVVFPMTTPNGVALSPRGDRLYVAETITNRIWSFDIEAPGQLAPLPGGRRLLVAPGGNQGFDSIKVEAGGNICAATLGRGGISVFSPDGNLVEFVAMPDPVTTNICFGGADRRTAFVTLSGSGRLVGVQWRRPGLRLAF